MRLIAYPLTLVALAGVWFAGQELKAELEAPPRVPPEPTVLALAEVDAAEPVTQAARDWPALFGEIVVPEPQPPDPEPQPPDPEPEPQPPERAAPPLDSLGFSLKGVVSDGHNRWALVSHPTGEQILKVGDRLSEDYTVTRIDEQGLWAEVRGEEALLGFPAK